MTDKIISIKEFENAANDNPKSVEVDIAAQLFNKLDAGATDLVQGLAMGFDTEGNFVMVTSEGIISRDALWLVEVAKQYILQ